MEELNRSPSPRRASSLGEVTIDMLFRQVDEHKREVRTAMKTLRELCEADLRAVLSEVDGTRARVESLEDVVAMQGNQVLHDIFEALTGARRPGSIADEICKFIHKLVEDKFMSFRETTTPRRANSPRRVVAASPSPTKNTPHQSTLVLSNAIEKCRDALAQHQINMDKFENAVRHDQNEIVKAVREIGMRQEQLQSTIATMQEARAVSRSISPRSPRRSGTALSIEEVFPHGTDILDLRSYIDNELRQLSSSVEASKELFLTSTTEMQSDLVTLQAKVERGKHAQCKGEMALLRQDMSTLTAAVDALQSLKDTSVSAPPTPGPEAQGAGSIRQRRAQEGKIDAIQQEMKTLASAVRKSQLSDKMLRELKNEVTAVSGEVKNLKEAAASQAESKEPSEEYCPMKDFNKFASKTTSEVAILKDQTTVLEGMCDQLTNDLTVLKGEVQDVRCPPPSPVDDGRYDTLHDELYKVKEQLVEEIKKVREEGEGAGDVPQELLGVMRKVRVDVETLEAKLGELRSDVNGMKEDRVTYRAIVEGQIETLSTAVENLQASAQSPLRENSPGPMFNPKDICDELKADQNDIKKEMMTLADEVLDVTNQVQELHKLVSQFDTKVIEEVRVTSHDALDAVLELQDIPSKVDSLRSEVDAITSKLSAKPALVSVDSLPSKSSCGGFTSIASPKAASPFEEQ